MSLEKNTSLLFMFRAIDLYYDDPSKMLIMSTWRSRIYQGGFLSCLTIKKNEIQSVNLPGTKRWIIMPDWFKLDRTMLWTRTWIVTLREKRERKKIPIQETIISYQQANTMIIAFYTENKYIFIGSHSQNLNVCIFYDPSPIILTC